MIYSFRYSHVPCVSHFTWEKTTRLLVYLFYSIHSPICYLISRLEQKFKRKIKKRWARVVRHIFLSKVLTVIHNYFPCYGLYFHPDTIHISPPADINQNITSLALLTDFPSFFFSHHHKGFSFPLHVLTTVIREVDGTCCAYLYESL